MSIELELWLDESGDFESDYKKHLNPSLVGGVLVKKGDITEETAREMIGKDYVHYNEEQGSKNIELLEKIKFANGNFVIFENEERVQIIDGDTTYLNVLAEGIIRLLLHLSAIHGDFKLNILIATRKNTVEGRGIIGETEYEYRLRERIIVGLAKNVLTRKNKWEYHIEFDDARTSSLLMLADGVCNTYLTRTSGKFNDNEKQLIRQLYDEQYIFSFYEHSTEVELKQSLTEGNISKVIFECYLESNKEIKEKYLSLALDQLSELDEYGQTLQLRAISTTIETFIKIDRNYQYIRPVLIAMQDDLLPKLVEREIDIPFFHLDVILYLYSLYTHEGNIKATEQDHLFMDKLHDVKDIMVKFEYFNMYKLRRAVNQKNMFDIKGSIDDSTKAITVLEEMIELMDVLDDGNITKTKGVQKYVTLGKAYGTRGQGYTMLIHGDINYLEKAVNDFDHALQHFYLERDKERQYIYKSQAFTEAGQFEEAVASLYQACGANIEEDSFEQLLNRLKNGNVNLEIFKYHSYFKIMASAAQYRHHLADTMYEALIKTGVNVEQLKSQYRYLHPMQFIFWNFATYLFTKNKHRPAHKYLDEAIDLCNVPYSEQTIRVIQLGMYAEKLLALKEKKQRQQENHVKQMLQESLKRLEEEASNASLVFDYLEGINQGSFDHEEKLRRLTVLTRCIN